MRVEPLAVAQRAVRDCGVGPEETCLVVGAGSQGLLICQSLLALGARPLVSEPHQGRLELASELGAEVATPEDGSYRYVFESSGCEPGFRDALNAADKTAVGSLIGQSTAPCSLVTQQIVQRRFTLRGALIYDHPGDFERTRASLGGDLEPERITQATATPARGRQRAHRRARGPGQVVDRPVPMDRRPVTTGTPSDRAREPCAGRMEGVLMSDRHRRLGVGHLTAPDLAPPELVTLAARAGFGSVGVRLTTTNGQERRWPVDVGSPLLLETVQVGGHRRRRARHRDPLDRAGHPRGRLRSRPGPRRPPRCPLPQRHV
ncbi:hypothetical protein FHX42_001859 [Saccharopolyspora lacisalsi]|uniref:Alcohol dehydrogenase-like C-terminal domain-containing protein n=1 Tax=Halosaccharopolyspora lacisalsi TaxID=1000566 RepID=A0A839DR99_9PSEU|nr:zinc-binding dehydrogenase [Halosaccharopolyspora lacisalsi]MBA8824512.1 hypothetical protein [Halosaccharopolyspora lacisalsi]